MWDEEERRVELHVTREIRPSRACPARMRCDIHGTISMRSQSIPRKMPGMSAGAKSECFVISAIVNQVFLLHRVVQRGYVFMS
jgi:hypothetical protein